MEGALVVGGGLRLGHGLSVGYHARALKISFDRIQLRFSWSNPLSHESSKKRGTGFSFIVMSMTRSMFT